jgi:hypothetical protein
VYAGYAKSSIAVDDQPYGSYWAVTCLTLDTVCLTGLAEVLSPAPIVRASAM